MTKPAATATTTTDEATGNADQGARTSQAQSFRDATDKIRQRLDTTTKGLGALATAGVTAIGVAKVGDIYPIPAEAGWTDELVVAAFVAMVAAVAGLIFRLWNVQRPVVVVSNVDQMEIRGDEGKDVDKIFNEVATLNNVPSLRAYEGRAHRWERIADRVGGPQAVLLRDQAQRIRSDVQVALARAGHVVVRRRASAAVRGPVTGLLYLLFIVGFLGFALGADYLDSKRSQEIAVAKSCADAVQAGAAEGELPDICAVPDPPPGDPQAEVDAGAEVLGTALTRCRAAARGTPSASAEPCDRLQAAWQLVLGEPETATGASDRE